MTWRTQGRHFWKEVGFLYGVGAKEKEFPNGRKILKGVDHGKRRGQSD